VVSLTNIFLLIQYILEPLTKANYLVLGTDYESYAVVYSCTSVTPLANFSELMGCLVS